MFIRANCMHEVIKLVVLSECLPVRWGTKQKVLALVRRNGFRNTDEAVSFLLEFYETATRRKLLLKELEVTSSV